MHYITETLLVGNAQDAEQPPPFVNGVLFLAEERRLEPPSGIIYARLPLKEFEEADPAVVSEAVAWLEEHAPSKRLMVCCRAGLGRSVSIVIAYLCCVKEMSYAEALQLLKARRPGATPLPNLAETIEKVQRMRRERHGQPQIQTPP
jgi:protein-tyrosine phosphatase